MVNTSLYFGKGRELGSWNMIADESYGIAIDATSEGGSISVKDNVASTNQRRNQTFDASNIITNLSTSPKMVHWNSSPYSRWVPHNLLLSSEDTLNSAVWTNAGVTITPDATTAPNGFPTADKVLGTTTGDDRLQSFTVLIGVVYTLSVYLKAGTGARWFRLQFEEGSDGTRAFFDVVNGVVGTDTVFGTGYVNKGSSIQAVGNGWYRCSTTVLTGGTTGAARLKFNAADGGVWPVSPLGAGTEFYTWGWQLNRGPIATNYIPTTTAARYGAPQEYDVDRGLFGIRFEPASTNLILRSEEFDNASWTKSNMTTSANATTSPDGSTTADQITTTLAGHSLNQTITCVTLTDYILSVYIKASTNTQWVFLRGTDNGTNGVRAWFDVLNGVAGTQAAHGTGWTAKGFSMKNIGNGWYRCTCVVNTTGTVLMWDLRTATADASSTGVNAAVFFVWGAQVEVAGTGSFMIGANIASSYIQTLGATVTRAIDTLQVTAMPNPTVPFSTYVDIKRSANSSVTPRHMMLYGVGGAANSVHTRTSIGFEVILVQDNNNAQMNPNFGFAPEMPTNTRFQITCCFNTNDTGMSLDGQTEVTDTLCSIAVPLTTIQFCQNSIINNGTCWCYIYRYVVAGGRAATATKWYNI